MWQNYTMIIAIDFWNRITLQWLLSSTLEFWLLYDGFNAKLGWMNFGDVILRSLTQAFPGQWSQKILDPGLPGSMISTDLWPGLARVHDLKMTSPKCIRLNFVVESLYNNENSECDDYNHCIIMRMCDRFSLLIIQ